MALKSILTRSLPELESAMDNMMTYHDIDYEVVNPRKTKNSVPWTTITRSTVMKNERAIANAYRLWLQSKEYDYPRKPGFGNFFKAQLNDRFPFSPESEEGIASALVQESNTQWPDIKVLECKVKCGLPRKVWIVSVLIADKNTGLPIELFDTEI